MSVPRLNIRYNERRSINEKPPSRGNSEAFIQYTYLYKRGKYEILLRSFVFRNMLCVCYVLILT